jgi:hypothetical protein
VLLGKTQLQLDRPLIPRPYRNFHSFLSSDFCHRIFERERQFADALSAMSYDNPAHRSILDAEGLQRWLPPHLDGYAPLRQAAAQQGFFNQLLARPA